MTALAVSALYQHPIKSCAAQSVTSLTLDERGPVHDRRWMLVDPNGRFITQRTQPRLSQVFAEPTDDGVLLSGPHGTLHVARPNGETTAVRVWSDSCTAQDAGDDAARYFSTWLGAPCRLVRQRDEDDRTVDSDYGDGPVGFADGFPLLIVSDATLAHVAGRVQQPADARRFRPNIVVSGAAPFEEDHWARIRIGTVDIDLVKPCSRCVMITVDPDTSEKGPEPLRDLASYRRQSGGVMVGYNGIHRACGGVTVGMPVTVLEQRP